jgi:hypothetical protein
MIKSKKLLFTIALVLSCFAMSQAQSAKEMLTQKWVYSIDAVIAQMKKSMSAKEKQELANMTDEQKAMLRSMVANMSIEFKRDGTCEVIDKHEKTSMTWELSADGKTLTTTEKGKNGKPDDVSVVQIVELNSSKLVVKEKDSTETMVFVPKNAKNGKD